MTFDRVRLLVEWNWNHGSLPNEIPLNTFRWVDVRYNVELFKVFLRHLRVKESVPHLSCGLTLKPFTSFYFANKISSISYYKVAKKRPAYTYQQATFKNCWYCPVFIFYKHIFSTLQRAQSQKESAQIHYYKTVCARKTLLLQSNIHVECNWGRRSLLNEFLGINLDGRFR